MIFVSYDTGQFKNLLKHLCSEPPHDTTCFTFYMRAYMHAHERLMIHKEHSYMHKTCALLPARVVTNLQTGLDQRTGLMDQKIGNNLPCSYA